MNRLRTTYGTLGVIAVTVASSLMAVSCGGTSSSRLPTVGGSTAAAVTTVSDTPWVAYSTAGASDWHDENYGRHGSDVLIARPGQEPKLVRSRGSGDIWNICPTFSPDGRLLAFASILPHSSEIFVVSISHRGPVGASRVVVRLPVRRALCPRWSSDGTSVAYLDNSSGKVIVHNLVGSNQRWTDRDPRPRDFLRDGRTVLSPTGRLIARTLSDGKILVSRRNGSHTRILALGSYAVAGWSPDGRKVLIMNDVGNGFEMRAVTVRAPYRPATFVAYTAVNNDRSWPGYGDVSWQPTPVPIASTPAR
jgi:Tol biopolymer transport system component